MWWDRASRSRERRLGAKPRPARPRPQTGVGRRVSRDGRGREWFTGARREEPKGIHGMSAGGHYDFALAGGRVICPASGLDGVMDVAVRDGAIAAVGSGLADRALEKLDCSGKIVTPGLIDSHAHVHSSIHAGVDADLAGVRSGAAVVVDGGGSGYLTYDEFRRRDLQNHATDVYCLMSHNPLGQAILPEVWAPGRIRFSRDRLVETILSDRRRILGLKDRAVGSFIMGRGIGGIEEGREICAECGIPYVVHVGVDASDDLPDSELDVFTRGLLRLLAPGDIVAHACTGKRGRLFRADGAFDRELADARSRGVIFDACGGVTNFSAEAFRIGREHGFLPRTLSTDLTSMSAKGPSRNLGTVMSKLMALGVDLPTVAAWTTSEAARAMGLADRKGSLAPGRQADITVSELRKGDFRFLDRAGGETFAGRELLAPVMTFLAGKKFMADNGGGPASPE